MRDEAENGAGAGKRFHEQGGAGRPAGIEDNPTVNVEAQLAEERRRAAWAGAAEAYESSAEPWTNQAAKVMIGLAPLKPRAELIDFGCGTGGLAIAAQTLGALVTAYDIAPSMIAAATSRTGGRAVEFRIGEIRALLDREGAFDVATGNFSFVESGEPEAALREAYRALKPGGMLLWTCWPAPTGGALFEVVDAARLASEGLGARKPISRGLKASAAAAMTEAAGFTGVETVTLPLENAADAPKILEASEKLDVSTPQARARSQTLEALEEALKGAATLKVEATLVVAEKPAVAAAPKDDEAAQEASAAKLAAPEERGGGLLGLFRRWMGRR